MRFRWAPACLVLAVIFAVWNPLLARAEEVESASPSLDRGFRLLYDLDFTRAQQEFTAYERRNPEDPLGPVAVAAGLLFSELNRLGVLESQFFEDDRYFRNHPKLSPDKSIQARFTSALEQANNLARRRLSERDKDADALFVLALSAGLSADYAALIEKRNMAALHYTREATVWAQQLLASNPGYYDAYIATGTHKYIIGSMPAPMRWMLRLGGIRGDKQAGMADLERAADHGRYLAPFARILLAIAYLRQHDTARARLLLTSLHEQFPNNGVFVREIARLDRLRQISR